MAVPTGEVLQPVGDARACRQHALAVLPGVPAGVFVVDEDEHRPIVGGRRGGPTLMGGAAAWPILLDGSGQRVGAARR
ncbi:hypothetical protein [Ilumatobacter sp.]|uniref:hypothetical protein n=1 Tax=Ilumatobacter sp. TaxID=1967498 RepID=UPI003AF5E6DC